MLIPEFNVIVLCYFEVRMHLFEREPAVPSLHQSLTYILSSARYIILCIFSCLDFSCKIIQICALNVSGEPLEESPVYTFVREHQDEETLSCSSTY